VTAPLRSLDDAKRQEKKGRRRKKTGEEREGRKSRQRKGKPLPGLRGGATRGVSCGEREKNDLGKDQENTKQGRRGGEDFLPIAEMRGRLLYSGVRMGGYSNLETGSISTDFTF